MTIGRSCDGSFTLCNSKGFEYQDLVCCHSLLSLLETESLDLEFEIESDEVEHVDDLVVFEDTSSVVGKQVKFHVDQDHAESFDTLTKKRTPRSSSLLEKLYQGWKSLKDTGSIGSKLNSCRRIQPNGGDSSSDL